MKKTTSRTLRLSRETIRSLAHDHLRGARGGMTMESAGGGCEPPSTQPTTKITDTKTDLSHQGC